MPIFPCRQIAGHHYIIVCLRLFMVKSQPFHATFGENQMWATLSLKQCVTPAELSVLAPSPHSTERLVTDEKENLNKS